MTRIQILEVAKATYVKKIGYLLVGQDRIAFVDLNPKVKMDEKDSSVAKIAAATALFGLAAGAVTAIPKHRFVDTEEKKHLRDVFDEYLTTRDKSLLESVSMNQILEADTLLDLQKRTISYASISKVTVEKPRKLIVRQQVRTGLEAEIYGSSKTWKFDVLANDSFFQDLLSLLKQLLPSEVFS